MVLISEHHIDAPADWVIPYSLSSHNMTDTSISCLGTDWQKNLQNLEQLNPFDINFNIDKPAFCSFF